MNWKNAEQADRIRHLEEQAEELTNKIQLLEEEKEEAEKQKLEAGKSTNILSLSVCRGGKNRKICVERVVANWLIGQQFSELAVWWLNS